MKVTRSQWASLTAHTMPLIASRRWKSNQTRFKTQLPLICCVTLDSRLTSLRPSFLMTISSENCEALSSACCIMGNSRKMWLPPPHLFPSVPPECCLPKGRACQSQWQLGKIISQYFETTNNEAYYSVGAYSMPGFTRSSVYIFLDSHSSLNTDIERNRLLQFTMQTLQTDQTTRHLLPVSP